MKHVETWRTVTVAVEVSVEVSDAEPVAIRWSRNGARIAIARIRFTYVKEPDETWGCSVHAYGAKLKKDGTPGSNPGSTTFRSGDDTPAWIKDLAAHYAPAGPS